LGLERSKILWSLFSESLVLVSLISQNWSTGAYMGDVYKFLMRVCTESVKKKGETIQGGTLVKEIRYMFWTCITLFFYLFTDTKLKSKEWIFSIPLDLFWSVSTYFDPIWSNLIYFQIRSGCQKNGSEATAETRAFVQRSGDYERLQAWKHSANVRIILFYLFIFNV
jgi:hypothetical protein